ncbi:MAG: universal stress protein [Solirubrobacterales bacterium]|nr:universal stress protein [Solirubrobacterales bacterium]
MFRRIIVAAHGDDAPTRDALALAATFARAGGAEVLLAGVWASPLGAGDAVYEGVVRKEMEAELRRLRDELPEDLHARSEVRGSTSVVRGLHRIVDDEAGDLLVVGPSHLGRMSRALRGDVALGAVHDAPCAIAVAPEGLRDRPSGGEVVVAWDGSPEARLALEAGVDHARATSAGLRVVYVLESPYRYAEVPIFDEATAPHWLASTREGARRLLDEAAVAVGDRVPVVTELREGMASVELAETSRTAGLLVVGSRGYGALRRLVVGSTSAALLARVDAPLLLLPRGAAEHHHGDRHGRGHHRTTAHA